jgi:hypothetical protein
LVQYTLNDYINKKVTSKDRTPAHTRINARVTDITDSGALDHVPHSKSLDSLVFCDTSRAIGAANDAGVSAAILVTAIISSFLRL